MRVKTQDELEYEEFEKTLIEAIGIYYGVENVNYPQLDIFINDVVWESLEKYTRMELTTKEKFFDSLYNGTSLEDYEKGIYELWGNVDHSYMSEAIQELQKMVIQRDFKGAEMYGDKKITTRSVKLENAWQEYQMIKKNMYEMTPERDFKAIEQRYMNRHIKLYKNTLKRISKSTDVAQELTNLMKTYDKLDKTIPYFSHKTGDIVRYVDVSTYNSMLYNVNLTRSAWNRTFYDALLLGNNLFLLDAHMFSCPACAYYQGYVYALGTISPRDSEILGLYGKTGAPYMSYAIEGGVGHPNCSHVWIPFYDETQLQEDKYNSPEWEEKYKNKQKIQSLDLQKARLLADRRIYKELGQQDLVDKTTAKIKNLRSKSKELAKEI